MAEQEKHMEVKHYPLDRVQARERALAKKDHAATTMRPLMEAVAGLLEGNVTALNEIVAHMEMQNERIAALERTLKRRMPVTSVQVRYMNEAIRTRAHALLDGKDGIDNRDYTKLARLIRRDVMVRCGVSSLREMPDHEYSVSMEQIKMWSDALAIRNIMWEAQDRVEAETARTTEPAAGVDGT